MLKFTRLLAALGNSERVGALKEGRWSQHAWELAGCQGWPRFTQSFRARNSPDGLPGHLPTLSVYSFAVTPSPWPKFKCIRSTIFELTSLMEGAKETLHHAVCVSEWRSLAACTVKVGFGHEGWEGQDPAACLSSFQHRVGLGGHIPPQGKKRQ